MSAIAERASKQTGINRWYVKGPLLGAFSSAALMYACALLFAKEVLPYGLLPYITIACVFAGCAAGGALAASARGKGRLPAGLMSGAAVLLLILIFTFASEDGSPASPQFVKMAIAALGGGIFGGALSAGRASKMHKKKRRIR